VDIAPEGFPLVNQGRIFTPFWTEGVVAKPAPRGGRTGRPAPTIRPRTTFTYWYRQHEPVQGGRAR
jgi:hypothetical protein